MLRYNFEFCDLTTFLILTTTKMELVLNASIVNVISKNISDVRYIFFLIFIHIYIFLFDVIKFTICSLKYTQPVECKHCYQWVVPNFNHIMTTHSNFDMSKLHYELSSRCQLTMKRVYEYFNLLFMYCDSNGFIYLFRIPAGGNFGLLFNGLHFSKRTRNRGIHGCS